MNERVELIHEITPELPQGSMGTVIDDRALTDADMVLVRWDCGVDIPMYRREVKEIKPQAAV